MKYILCQRRPVYLVLNPKRELEFKMAVTVGLQDISSVYITLGHPYVYILYVYYLRIKLEFASVDPSNERDNDRH